MGCLSSKCMDVDEDVHLVVQILQENHMVCSLNLKKMDLHN